MHILLAQKAFQPQAGAPPLPSSAFIKGSMGLVRGAGLFTAPSVGWREMEGWGGSKLQRIEIVLKCVTLISKRCRVTHLV